MNIKTKLFIDRFFGQIFCFTLVPIVYCSGKILRIDHSINNNNVKNIAVAKYFGIGSITHSVPMLKALKRKYPSAKLIFITRVNNKELLPLIPYIDETLYINDSGFVKLFISSLKVLFKLQRKRIDLFFDLEVFSSYGTMMSVFSLARNRFGFFWAKSTGFKIWLCTHLMYFNFNMPLRMSYMQLSHLAKTDTAASIDLEPFNLDETIYASAREKIGKIFANDASKLFCINVNASDLSYTRRWRLENFAKTALHFAEKGYNILLLGSQDEKEYINTIYDFITAGKEITCRIYNAAGYFSLKEVLAVLRLCDIFLTNDSGLMNLGYAQETKTVSIYGASIPQFVHIDNGVNAAIYKKTYCSPCVHIFDTPPCGNLSVCINNITPPEVIDTVENVLKTDKKSSHAAFPLKGIIAGENNGYVMGTLIRKS
ncbi:MAG: glycosyltransferase family 9 protein [Endomicrobium sp.]|jgi:ADP-heptose:LPS heptosyltransferase|nr:glycosyltransferase family 9 protein [Endomicrobium sp.]